MHNLVRDIVCTERIVYLLPPPNEVMFLVRFICLFCLSVCLSAGLRKKLLTDIDEIWWLGGPWSKDQPIRFW